MSSDEVMSVESGTPVHVCPLQILTVNVGIMRLAFHLGSIDYACCWLANWNFTYLDHWASFLPPSTRPSPQDHTPAISSSSSWLGSLPQGTGSSWVASQWTPGSASLTCQESMESFNQQQPPASTFKCPGDFCWFPAASGLDFVNFPGDCQDLPIDAIDTVPVSIGSADLALVGHRDLLHNVPPMTPKCWQYFFIRRK